MSHTWIIAEVGTTWETRSDLRALIHAAAAAGCDAVKFQWCGRPAELAAARAMPTMPASYAALAFPSDWLPGICAEIRRAGLQAACSVYLADDVDRLRPHVDALKIASFESGCEDLAARLAHRGLPLWVSTGMATEAEAVAAARRWRLRWPTDALFHCVSAYPAPLQDTNLGVLAPLRQALALPVTVGLSDHSGWVGMGAAAVFAGAQALEVHVRLDTTPDAHPDCAVALRPAALLAYVAHARFAELLMGDGRKRLMPSEAGSRPWKR